MPIKKWSLEEVADYGRRFMRPGDRKVTLNFAPGPGEALDASAIARVFDPEHFLVKVTPINPTLSARRRKTAHVWSEAPESIRAAEAELRRLGFSVILSPSFPRGDRVRELLRPALERGLKAAAHAGLRAERRERRSYVTVDSMAQRCEDWLRELAGARRAPRFRAGAGGPPGRGHAGVLLGPPFSGLPAAGPAPLCSTSGAWSRLSAGPAGRSCSRSGSAKAR